MRNEKDIKYKYNTLGPFVISRILKVCEILIILFDCTIDPLQNSVFKYF